MPRLSKAEKEKREQLEKLQILKNEKVLNFIYETFQKSEFKDERIIKHITFKSEGENLGEVEMIVFCKGFSNNDTKYCNDDHLIMYRFGDKGDWNIINFDATEIMNSFTKEMFGVLMHSLSN